MMQSTMYLIILLPTLSWAAQPQCLATINPTASSAGSVESTVYTTVSPSKWISRVGYENYDIGM